MQCAVKLSVVIPPSHRLELALPDEVPAGPAEVIVLTGQPTAIKDPGAAMGMDRGKGWVAEDFDAPL